LSETVPKDNPDEAEETDEDEQIPEFQTRSGRNVKMPERLIAERNATASHYEIQLTPAEEKYYAAMKAVRKFGLIGALALEADL
jgi:hypothetical protein